MILIKTVLVDKIYENALLIFESMIFLVYREKKRVRRIKCEKEKDINRSFTCYGSNWCIIM